MEITLQNDGYVSLSGKHANSYYCGLIQNLYGGGEGELTNYLWLCYEVAILSPYYPELSQKMKEIANQEQKHLELLASAIIVLGGDPMFIDAQGRWWNGRKIDYIKDLKQVLQLCRENKEKCIIDYRLALEKISNSQIKALLERILKDEHLHLEIFKEELSKL